MDIRQLEYFLAVVDSGGFNRAATALYLAQPSLSQAIRALERDLNCLLFHRVGRGVVLTDAGEALVEPARQALRSLEVARASTDAVVGLRSGRVDVAAMPSTAMEPLGGWVAEFGARHPRMTVNIRAAIWPHEVSEMLRSGTAELGLVVTPEPADTPGLEVRTWGRHRFVVATAPDGPFAPGETISEEKLAGQRIVAGQAGTGIRRFVDRLKSNGVDVEIAVETDYRESILPLVLRGTGVAVLTEAWGELARRAGALVFDLEPESFLYISLLSRQSELTPAAVGFLEVAESRGLLSGEGPR